MVPAADPPGAAVSLFKRDGHTLGWMVLGGLLCGIRFSRHATGEVSESGVKSRRCFKRHPARRNEVVEFFWNRDSRTVRFRHRKGLDRAATFDARSPGEGYQPGNGRVGETTSQACWRHERSWNVIETTGITSLSLPGWTATSSYRFRRGRRHRMRLWFGRRTKTDV